MTVTFKSFFESSVHMQAGVANPAQVESGADPETHDTPQAITAHQSPEKLVQDSY
jgi:hypothetical protein